MSREISRSAGKAAACVALAATLSLAALPAWAAGDQPANTSKVQVTTTVDNLVADVPVSLPVEVLATGGAAKTVPTNYVIKNNSAFPIKVSQVQAAAVEGWTIAPAALTAESTSTNTIGDIYLKLTPTGKDGVVLNTSAVSPTGWSMAGKADTANSQLAFGIDCSVSQLKKTFETAAEALTVTYVVEPDPTYAASVA